jgi:hypothetical protein
MLSPDCGQIMPAHPPQSTKRAWLASTSKSTAPDSVKGVVRIGNGPRILGSAVSALAGRPTRVSAARRITPDAPAIAAASTWRLVMFLFVDMTFSAFMRPAKPAPPIHSTTTKGPPIFLVPPFFWIMAV